jgi:autotransporter-associated beta strand protein
MPLAGTAGLIKDGAGTLVLAGDAANSIFGTIQVQQGKLELARKNCVALRSYLWVGSHQSDLKSSPHSKNFFRRHEGVSPGKFRRRRK